MRSSRRRSSSSRSYDRRRRRSYSRSRSGSRRGRRKGRGSLFSGQDPEKPPSTEGVNLKAQVPDPTCSRDYKWIKIPHERVGFVIGPHGSHLQACERQTGTAISINQATKGSGYSVAQISGPNSIATDAAVTFIEQRCSEWEQHPARHIGTGACEHILIEQKMVGIILGKGGEALKMMMQQSQTNIKLDHQSKKDQNICILKIDGTTDAVASAKKMIMQRMTQVNIMEGNLAQYNIRINQEHVPKFVGKNGKHIQLMKTRSGADILVDQKSKHLGFSTIRIGVGPGADFGLQLVREKLEEQGVPVNVVGQEGQAYDPSLLPQANEAVSGQPPVPSQPNDSATFGQPPVPMQPNEQAYGTQPSNAAFGQPPVPMQPNEAAYGQPPVSMQPNEAAYGQPQAAMPANEFAYGQPPPVTQPNTTFVQSNEVAFGQPPVSMQGNEGAYGQPQVSLQPNEFAFGQPSFAAQPNNDAHGQLPLTMQPHQASYETTPNVGFGQPPVPMQSNDATYGQPPVPMQPQASMQPNEFAYGQPSPGTQPDIVAYGQPSAAMQSPAIPQQFNEAAYGQSSVPMQPNSNAYGMQVPQLQPNEAYGQPPASFQLNEAAYGQPSVAMQPGNTTYGQPPVPMQPNNVAYGQAPVGWQSNAFAKAPPSGPNLQAPAPNPYAQPAGPPIEESYRIDQRWVSWVTGKDGETLRKIKAQTGTLKLIELEPDPNDKAFHLLKVKNAASPQAQRALQQITQKIEECMNMPAIRGMLGATLPPAMTKMS